MLRDSDYNRLAASFHQFLQEYSCDAECEGLGMPEDAACSNFIHYYKLVLIVLWRQALEFVFPKYARPVFKQFMAQLQQSLPASQRKKQYSALMDTLGTISALLQQDQGVIKLAQQCVATFAAQNSEDPAARVMRLTRQTLEHLQRHVDQLTGLREQDFNDLSSALAVAFAPPANSPDPALKATSKAPAATPQAASVAVTEEDPEADIETLDDLVTTSEPPFLTVAAQDFPQDVGQDAPSAPDAAPQAVPEIVPEIVPVIEAEVALQAAPEFEPESEPEFEFVESSEHDAADPTAESPPPAAVSVDGVEIQFETAADDIPEAIIIPLDAAEPELLDLPEPPPPPASAEEPDAQEWRDTDDATPAASEEAFHEHGADPEAGEAFSIILDTDDADSPGMDPALDDEEAEEYALDLDDSMDDDPGHAQYEARPGGTSMPAPPPESLFEISAPPPQHLSHGRRAHSPPLVGSQRDNASRSARSNAAPQASPPKEPRVQPPPPEQADTRSKPRPQARASAPDTAGDRRRTARVNAEGLSVFINETARQLPLSNLSEHGLAAYHEGWAFAVEQVISLDLMTSYKVLMKDLQCRVIRCDATLMACKFINLDRQSLVMLRAIVKRLQQIRSRQAAGGSPPGAT